MFDGKNAKKIEYLEEERQKLWERITALEKQIAEKLTSPRKTGAFKSRKFRSPLTLLLIKTSPNTSYHSL